LIDPEEPPRGLADDRPDLLVEEPAFRFGPHQPGGPEPRKARDENRRPRKTASALARFLEAVGVADALLAADSLLREFGSLSELFAASRWRLRRIAGPRLAQVIRASRGLMRATLLEGVSSAPVMPPYRDLIDFLQLEIGFLQHERLIALYLDAGSRLLAIENVADGALGEVPLNIRKILTLGLGLEASAFLLVHNHPSGIPVPSQSDLAITAHLRQLGNEVDLRLIDHLIIARGQVGSIEDYWREARIEGAP
jgi:DNA repair protein RadC